MHVLNPVFSFPLQATWQLHLPYNMFPHQVDLGSHTQLFRRMGIEGSSDKSLVLLDIIIPLG